MSDRGAGPCPGEAAFADLDPSRAFDFDDEAETTARLPRLSALFAGLEAPDGKLEA